MLQILPMLIDKPRRSGRFLHPAIISGVKYFYFDRSLGSVSPCDDIAALADNLTAEAVAWVCLSISQLNIIILILDILGFENFELLRHDVICRCEV